MSHRLATSELIQHPFHSWASHLVCARRSPGLCSTKPWESMAWVFSKDDFLRVSTPLLSLLLSDEHRIYTLIISLNHKRLIMWHWVVLYNQATIVSPVYAVSLKYTEEEMKRTSFNGLCRGWSCGLRGVHYWKGTCTVTMSREADSAKFLRELILCFSSHAITNWDWIHSKASEQMITSWLA